ncbi:beta-N-acetylhexosaminidase [Actinoalloteichus caeruleus]|uniref:beta-N-acetylhexosaminidase n=1 Tax=Actinoalloteichus cyanogriseus TaxID=2893586 RepID=UPI003AAF13DA
MSFDGLLPRPVSAVPTPGRFTLDTSTALVGDRATADTVRWLRRRLGAATGLPLNSTGNGGSIRFTLDRTVPGPAGYRIELTERLVTVAATDPAGAHHAAQTLRQLLGPAAFRAAPTGPRHWSLPCGRIVDRPRFGWRGCLLDVARHFLPTREVLRFVDLAAAHKLNVLHLHLTDDQGWRLEVPRYPRLTEVGGWRRRSMVGRGTPDAFDDRPHGGHYTTTDLREIVAYAAEQHVMVVPEVDVPGHSQAAIAAYPELGNEQSRLLDVWPSWGVNSNILNASDHTVAFFRDVFDHVMEVFPSPVVCLGGDEVPTEQWDYSPLARRRAAELGLARPADLHGWFVRRMVDHLHDRGRRALGWDEILDGPDLPAEAVIGCWRGVETGHRAAAAGHDVLLCPEQHVYLDHRQSDHPDEPVPVGFLRTLADVYRYEPVPPGTPDAVAARVLGAQAQLWSEHLDSPRRVDYAAFPRLAAFAEVVWSPREAREPDGFERRLAAHHLPRLDALGVEYRPLTGPRPWQTRPGVAGRPR